MPSRDTNIFRHGEMFRGIQSKMAKLEEGLLFPKEEWDSPIREEKCTDEGNFPKQKWSPVALDPYENAPKKVKEYHEAYIKFWLKDR